jgi:two-component system KDP operon response regulator KdpE
VADKILVIDDDVELLDLTETWLQKSGYEPCLAKDGAEGLRKVYSSQPALVLLDINMPQMNGWDVCHRIRELCDVPIIMVSVNRQEADKLRGFGLGVDDYVTKPFHFPELIARVEAVLRRTNHAGKPSKSNKYCSEDIEIDWVNRQITVRGERVSLTPTEFRLLHCLVENHGWVVTHEQLLRKVWGANYFGDKSYVKLYIRYLRQKLELDPTKPRMILTERGIGYRFNGN